MAPIWIVDGKIAKLRRYVVTHVRGGRSVNLLWLCLGDHLLAAIISARSEPLDQSQRTAVLTLPAVGNVRRRT
jgi:hypothetical protein